MARIDDYRRALELGRQEVRNIAAGEVARITGARYEAGRGEEARVCFPFLGRPVEITWPEVEVRRPEQDASVPIQEQVLLLHYLQGFKSLGLTNRWISYQEVPDGRFYLDAFQKRAKAPLVAAFGACPEKLAVTAEKLYGATPFDQGDHGVRLEALPGVPVALILWEGDEEFPPEGNILFDESIKGILSAEDIAWLAGMVVYPLIGALRSA